MAITNSASRNDVGYNRIPPEVREKWKVVRDVVSGDQAIRTDASYLPILNATDNSQANIARNAAYRTRAVWYPATQFTLDGFIGLAFRNDPTNEIENNAKLAPLLTDVDGAGVSLYQQSQAALANVLQVGRHGLFVDWAEGLGRPVIKSYNAESIINWDHEIVGGQAILSLVVLYEEVEERVGRYEIKRIPQWREIWLENGAVNVRVWRETAEQVNGVAQLAPTTFANVNNPQGPAIDTLQLRSRGKLLTQIPFTFIGSQNNDAGIDGAPLYGLAQLNCAHFRNSADYEDSVFFVGQVQPWITGLDTEWRDHLENPTVEVQQTDGTIIRQPTGQRMYVGSRTPILLPQGSQFGYAQAQPNQIVKEAMDQKEAQMIAVGARMIEATPGSRTATEDENDKEATTSVLSICVSNVNEAYQRAIWFCAQYLDLGETFDAADAYKINQDFTRGTPDAQVLSEMVKSWQTGITAKNDVRAYMRRVGMVATERSDTDIENDLQNEGPRLGTLGLDPKTGLPIQNGNGSGNAGTGIPANDGAPASAIPPTGNGASAGSGAAGGGSGNASAIPSTGGSNGGTPFGRRASDNPASRNAPSGNGDAGANGGNANAPGQTQNAGDGANPSRTANAGNVVPINRNATPPANDVTDVTPRMIPADLQSTPPFDIAPILEAIRAAMDTIRQGFASIPAPIVNMPPINVAAPVVNVESPSVTVNPPAVTVNIEKGNAGNKTGSLVPKEGGGYDFNVQPTLPN
jgi:hypothetical protein